MWTNAATNASPCAQKKADSLLPSLSPLFSHWSRPTAEQPAASLVGLDGGEAVTSQEAPSSLSLPRHAAAPPPVAKFH